MSERFDAIVIGSSPAGLTAAISLGRAGRKVVLLEQSQEIESVRLLSLPVAKATLGDLPRNESMMRAMTRVRRVSTHKKNWAATEVGTPTADKADLISVEMDDFIALLGKIAEDAGVHRRGGFKGLLVEEGGRVRGVKTTDGDDIFALATIIADGETSESAAAVAPLQEPLLEQEVLVASETWDVGHEHLNTQLNALASQGELTLITGELLGGLANSKAWIIPGSETLSLGVTLPREAAEAAHVTIDDALNRILTHPAFSRYFKGGKRERRVLQVKRRGGLSDLRRLFGDGWLVVGDAAGIRDPRHPYELRMELTSGHCAAEAVTQALDVKDSSRMTLGLYKRMLMDSYVWPELKFAENEMARHEKNPDFDAYYPELMVRRLALDLEAGTEARTELHEEFSGQVRNERPLWDLIKAGVSGFRVFG
jgi:electron transfer flavoprotein-quinone oxidoreductase